MKRLNFILISLFVLSSTGSAVTYLKYWANGVQTNAMTQGAQFAWEYDVSAVGGSAMVSLYLDLDGSETVNEGDLLLIQFEQIDGSVSQEGPPADSSATPDGLIYSHMGIFGFAPADYIFHIKDSNDNTEIAGALKVNAPPSVNVRINGSISIEGVSAPDQRLANIMVEASDQNDDLGFWSDLSDENGNYSINLPDEAVNTAWEIRLSFEQNYQEYFIQPQGYNDVYVNTGNNGPYDLYFKLPETFVYGAVLNEAMQIVPVSDYGRLENQRSGQGIDFQIQDGYYHVGAGFEGADTVDVPFALNIWGMGLMPDYLAPATWNNPDYNFTLSKGDSVEKNIYVLATNAVIYARVTMDGQAPNQTFTLHARNDSVGYAFADCDAQGWALLHIRSGYSFYTGVQTEQDGQSILPVGYYIENGNWRPAQAGDTVVFNLAQTKSVLAGSFTLAAGDQQPFNGQDCQVNAYSQNWYESYSGIIKPDSMLYRIYVPNGTFSVQFDNWTQDFLAKPLHYENISVNNTTIDTLDFELNYAHAQLVVRLKGVPSNFKDFSNWMHISTIGVYPYFYETNTEANSDTSFVFRVCDGSWYIFPPYMGPEYYSTTPPINIYVENDSTYYYVEFEYTYTTAIHGETLLPTQFYVKKNYPNPFNPQTTIEFGLPQRTEVHVAVFDLQGRLVEILLDGVAESGVHKIVWQAGRYASGIYICRVVTSKQTLSTRMILIK